VDSNNVWHTIHDERCFSLGHQIAQHVAETEGLHGWLDVGDLADLAAPSRHNPTAIDIRVEGLNKTWQRLSEEFALRRFVVGEKGELVVLSGNHDLRLSSSAAQKEPWLVGMRRADSVGDEHPVLSVPYLSRAQDYGVEWVPSFPSGYRKLNSNLVAFHSPSYGSKALETARKIAAKVHMSVYHGHTHRREALAENIETDRGARTLEIWSDGTWARIDGSLPGASSTRDEYGNRLMAGRLVNEKWGVLTPSMHQGLSIIHVEVGGRERFSAERIAFWDGWAQFRGKEFASAVDAEGNPHA
jgi:3',5'-cyclic AMP phosphodiesterase CpdA